MSHQLLPYEFVGTRHNYTPDYLIRLRRNDGSELKLILEVKGSQSEMDRAKEAAAQRWVKAVNHHGSFGLWDLTVCTDPHSVTKIMEQHSQV